MRRVFLALLLSSMNMMAGEKPVVVVQLFNWNFAEIREALPKLQEVGYTHIHVSPVQKSLENGKWWGRYQPVDYRKIEGPLGTREEFVDLCKVAKGYGIGIVADVVLNHMAANPYVKVRRGKLLESKLPDFGVRDFHRFEKMDWNDEESVQNAWLFGSLPDLKTESPAVRKKLVAHLLDLQECGVSGFRVDAVRHIPAEDLGAIFGKIGEVDVLMGEMAEERMELFERHLEILPQFRFFDFPALHQAKAILEGEEAMSKLLSFDEDGLALKANRAVSFVRNHDIERGEVNPNEGLGDERFRIAAGLHQLAYGMVFGLDMGIPYVFAADPKLDALEGLEETFDREFLMSGIQFYKEMSGLPVRSLRSGEDLLVVERGRRGLVVLARAASEPVTIQDSKLEGGRFVDDLTGVEFTGGPNFELPKLEGRRAYYFRLVD